MITQQTAEKIWQCHREIIVAEKLLIDIAKESEQDEPDRDEGTLRDAFGRRRHFEMGIPSGDNSHRIFHVSPDLAVRVIREHSENMRRSLVEANKQAMTEIAGTTYHKE